MSKNIDVVLNITSSSSGPPRVPPISQHSAAGGETPSAGPVYPATPNLATYDAPLVNNSGRGVVFNNGGAKLPLQITLSPSSQIFRSSENLFRLELRYVYLSCIPWPEVGIYNRKILRKKRKKTRFRPRKEK